MVALLRLKLHRAPVWPYYFCFFLANDSALCYFFGGESRPSHGDPRPEGHTCYESNDMRAKRELKVPGSTFKVADALTLCPLPSDGRGSGAWKAIENYQTKPCARRSTERGQLCPRELMEKSGWT